MTFQNKYTTPCDALIYIKRRAEQKRQSTAGYLCSRYFFFFFLLSLPWRSLYCSLLQFSLSVRLYVLRGNLFYSDCFIRGIFFRPSIYIKFIILLLKLFLLLIIFACGYEEFYFQYLLTVIFIRYIVRS